MRLHTFEKGLEGKVVIITGAAIGNGRAFCERLAEEGAHVVIADIVDAADLCKSINDAGGKAQSHIVDVTNADSVKKMVAEVVGSLGRIDILVHNVGYYQEEPFELTSLDDWRRMMVLNLDTLFITTQAIIPYMKKNGFGRIITMSSDTVWLGTPYLVHYVTAKMGIIGFTRSLASEMGKYGITVNCITVGLTATQRPTDSAFSSSILEHMLNSQAVRRADEPEDIANVVAFLSLPASGIITGQTINVDGGIAHH